MKFTVCDANGNSISDPNVVFQTGCCGSISLVSAVRGTVDNVNELGINDIPDVAFRYTGNQWIFNMATTSVQAGYMYTFPHLLGLRQYHLSGRPEVTPQTDLPPRKPAPGGEILPALSVLIEPL